MENKPDNGSAKDKAADLRRRAEEVLRGKTLERAPASREEVARILHDLRVHQIELEMQNDELRRAQEELEISRAKYFDLYDLAPVGYVTLNGKGLILEANLAAANLLGLERAALIKRPLSQFIVKEDANIYYMHRKQVIETREQKECELRMTKKDGSVFWAHIQECLTQDGRGEGVASHVTIIDITDRRKKEEDLQSALESLKKTQLQLMQSQKLATVGMLAAGVAHEINNPTAYIMTNLNVLGTYIEKLAAFDASVTAECVAPEKRERLRELAAQQKIADVFNDMPNLIKETHEGAERIAKIVQDLRLFARADEGQIEDVDINNCIERTLNIIRSEVNYKAELVKDYGVFSTVRGNQYQLSQVFMNIIVNAVQSIEKHGKISIKTYAREDTAVIEVSDTGRGILPENLRKIFDPFYTTKDVGKGTGLGLSISRAIVERHKGTIDVQGAVGGGTTVTIRLPVA